ncbi:SDR family NAD(P)-dependent oxidoreductase [Amorphus sp. 3PC139-8]|uniref:SDR family NAD(P)-dependent oxidoreductase n=1 Tax=Amorphus sp. 3PC139-8 TaxID=2735676 RepID=UPI00345C83F8
MADVASNGLRFEGQRALVSAGSGGIGLGIAKRLAAEGAEVVALGRTQETIDTAKQQAGTDTIRFIRVDLSDTAALKQTMGPLLEDEGYFDILVNNAGGSLHTPKAFLEASDRDWGRVIEMNIGVTVQLTRAVLPSMQRRSYGRIVNMGSKAGRYGSLFTGANYAAVKGAVQSMTLQLAQEFGPFGITCNAVCPGAIMTPRLNRLLDERMTPEERRAAEQAIPMRRHGTVEDVAAAVAFLASKEASFITGQLLDINGGQAMAS